MKFREQHSINLVMEAASSLLVCRCSSFRTHVFVIFLVIGAAAAASASASMEAAHNTSNFSFNASASMEAAHHTSNFTFNGFSGTGSTSLLALDGSAAITPGGLLALTNSSKSVYGHAFFSTPFQLKHAAVGAGTSVERNDSTVATAVVSSSFSTTFVFAIVPQYPDVGAHGVAFVMSPTKDLSGALPNQYLGLFNASDNGNSTNHVLAVELDTIQNAEFRDINSNHVGVNVNGLVSVDSRRAGWYADVAGVETFQNLSLISGVPMQVWVDYDAVAGRLDVTLAPLGVANKPRRTLLSTVSMLNLSEVLLGSMYVGFSSSTGSVFSSHYILGWSFAVGDGIPAPALDPYKLPKLPRKETAGGREKLSAAVAAVITLATAVAFLAAVAAVVAAVRRRQKFVEVLEDWELEYGPQRYKFKDLYVAAKGFKNKELLGVGGFGRVYRGLLPSSDGNQNLKQEVAIKRVSQNSWQGIREFVAEISSLGQIRHRNLVQLLGYCRREGELLLVYEFMPNGSLDNYLYYTHKDERPTTTASTTTRPALTIDWAMRLRIIKGVASGLLYLHEDCDKVVIHRDVKASNVLLDADMNARLGDFGLARLYDHGGDPRTTRVVGTMGYLAPELSRTGKATTAADVFAFGAFLLEVACGRRPIDPSAHRQQLLLLDWVAELWRCGRVLDAVDPRLEGKYAARETEMVLELGLLCSHPSPTARPSMRQVVQFLYGSVPQEFSSEHIEAVVAEVRRNNDPAMSFPSSSSTYTASDLGWSISGGR